MSRCETATYSGTSIAESHVLSNGGEKRGKSKNFIGLISLDRQNPQNFLGQRPPASRSQTTQARHTPSMSLNTMDMQTTPAATSLWPRAALPAVVGAIGVGNRSLWRLLLDHTFTYILNSVTVLVVVIFFVTTDIVTAALVLELGLRSLVQWSWWHGHNPWRGAARIGSRWPCPRRCPSSNSTCVSATSTTCDASRQVANDTVRTHLSSLVLYFVLWTPLCATLQNLHLQMFLWVPFSGIAFWGIAFTIGLHVVVLHAVARVMGGVTQGILVSIFLASSPKHGRAVETPVAITSDEATTIDMELDCIYVPLIATSIGLRRFNMASTWPTMSSAQLHPPSRRGVDSLPVFRGSTVQDNKQDADHFLVYAPLAVAVEMDFSFAIWAFLVHQREDMHDQAPVESSATRQLSREVLLSMRRGAMAHVRLDVPDGFEVLDDPVKAFSWMGDITNVNPTATTLESEMAELSCELEIPHHDLNFNEMVGRGNFGDTYRAEYNGKGVVVKTIRAQHFGDTNDEIVREFRHEAAVLNMFGHHPNIVPFVGASTDLTQPLALVTEYVPDGSLESKLGGPTQLLSLGQKESILSGAAAGVLNIHEGGFVHRDIAARNCLVHRGGVKICDFGMCRRVHGSFGGSYLEEGGVGPLKYMAPESLVPPHSFSYGSDVYSFGVLMWETFSEARPFSDLSGVAAAARGSEGREFVVDSVAVRGVDGALFPRRPDPATKHSRAASRFECFMMLPATHSVIFARKLLFCLFYKQSYAPSHAQWLMEDANEFINLRVVMFQLLVPSKL
ncbi:Aste57867_3691 [Aphanomyces stellatus]|uniref:Aste57867_3691 protein n=1 Tax=Aphanomyces stellatus TaxID=120398 RepID=A0A485KFX5_9STRA|nr:hypothetical protein As57867_003680 [Aphanomyces stellatus]VFT80846.1 Aste57867_3691 [Aphanomyces stellatus]